MPALLQARRFGRLAGWLVVLLSLAFVGTQVWQAVPWQLAAARLPQLSVAVTAGALVYGLGGFLLAEAWRQILAAEGEPSSALQYYAVYGRTQIAKYLPGNCFHFAGRQLLGRSLGHGQGRLALASLIETASLITIATAYALPLVWRSLDLAWPWSLPLAGLGAILLALAAGHAMPDGPIKARLRATWPGQRIGAPGSREWWRLVRAGLLHAVFFLLAGTILWLLTLVADSAQRAPLGPLACTAAMALAWVAGFATPGASAGIGVREAILIMLLTGRLGSEASAVAALAFRLVTTGGDALSWAIAMALPSPVGPTKVEPPPSGYS
jgi:hypothetical protein